MTRRCAPLAAGLAAVVLAGCSSDVNATSRDRVPTELHLREAYLYTPPITEDQAGAVAVGAARRTVAERLGRSRILYRRAGRPCTLYPILGTQLRDRFGSPVADEWEFCFDARGRLVLKTRIENR